MRRSMLLAIALIIPAISHLVVREIPGLYSLELLIYDMHVRALPSIPADDRLVLVGMDDESLNHLPLTRPTYPLPRTMHAKVVQALHDAGAKVIAFDVMFTAPIPDEDVIFGAAMENAKPVLCAIRPDSQIVGGEEIVTLTMPAPLLLPHVTPCSVLAPHLFGKVRGLMPDTVDYNTTDRYPHLSFALAQALGGNPETAPTVGDGEILIRFAGPAGTFKHVPYSEVFDGTWKQSRGSDFFRGKAVVIGTVSPFVDHAVTPLGDMQGVEVNIQATQAMLQGNWIRHWSELQNYLLKSTLCLLLIAVVLMMGMRQAFVFFLIEAVVWSFTAHQLFERTQVWADTLEPTLALLMTLIVVSAYEAARIRRVFHRFMPTKVAEQMLESSMEKPSSREIEATIVFCDVRDSTRLAETLPSATVEELLRQYFVAGEESAIRLGAELDKFVGDEIMLYFEDRRGFEGHAVRAVRWALEIQEACRRITESGLAGNTGFRVGVGISTGIVRLGTVGAARRIQHTVMGDAVNTASRIQALTKELGEPIVIGETTWDKVNHAVAGTPIGETSIRGKEKPVRLYKPERMQ